MPDDGDATFRLAKTVWPLRYSLTIRPELELGQFSGSAAIELEVLTATSELVCNAVDLDIGSAVLRSGTDETVLAVELDPATERVTFSAPAQLEPGPYTLECSFAAQMSERLRGFYRVSFTDEDGGANWIGCTQFALTDARRAFPCWDEPEFKAIFAVTLEIPQDSCAVSNSPELRREPNGNDHGVRVQFADTMPMSSYLVAWVVGTLEATEPVLAGAVPIRVIAAPGKKHLTAFALEVAAHALTWFEDYFGIAYPGTKLDLVGLPEFPSGAMENFGCVTFREDLLLCDAEQTSIVEQSGVAETIEHEIAHMWFGDLVTMGWWNGLWLNEAFATFMSMCCLDDFRPAWRRWSSFAQDRQEALRIDGLHATRPIELPVTDPNEALGMIDALTYLKGAAVLRMLEQYLGAERFRDGVRSYLKAHSYSTADTADLWTAIESVVNVPVRSMMEGWIHQGGFPLVTAVLTAGDLVLSEEPFAYLGEADSSTSATSAIGRDWLVPIKIDEREDAEDASGPRPLTGDKGFPPTLSTRGTVGRVPTRAELILTSAPARLTVRTGIPIVNAGGSGAYRLRYDGELFDLVASNLNLLEPTERFNVVADTWACVLAGIEPLAKLLSLFSQLVNEDDPDVWTVVESTIRLLDLAAAPQATEPLAAFTRKLLGPALDRVGWSPDFDESVDRSRTRAKLIGTLGSFGADESVRARAFAGFESAARRGTRLEPSTAPEILAVVVHAGGRGEFDAVREGYRHPGDPLDQHRHLIALAATTDTDLVSELLDMTTSEITPPDVLLVLRALLENRAAGPTAWRYVMEHWDDLVERCPAVTFPLTLANIAYLVHCDDTAAPLLAEEVRAHLTKHPLVGQQRLVEQYLELLAVHVRFVIAYRESIGRLLESATVLLSGRGD